MIEFLYFKFSLFLILLPIIYFLKNKKQRDINAFIIPVISSNIINKNKKKYRKNIFLIVTEFSYYLFFILIVLLFMHPVITSQKQNINYKGINIMLCMDISNSMLIEDFNPNRLEAAKNAAINFVNKQHFDKIGFVVFASNAITLTPLTLNHKAVINSIRNIKVGILGNGTAIGLGISSAILRLQKTQNFRNSSNIIILLTDGKENSGEISLIEAANIAAELKIKIYTIGIGKNDSQDNFDADLLKFVAKETNANFFYSNEISSIDNIYSQISSIEKTENSIVFHDTIISLQKYIIIIFLCFIIVEIILRITNLKLL